MSDMRWICVGYALDMRWICVGNALEMRGLMYIVQVLLNRRKCTRPMLIIYVICAFPMLHIASGLRRENASALFGFGNWINGVRMSGCRPVICRRQKCI